MEVSPGTFFKVRLPELRRPLEGVYHGSTGFRVYIRIYDGLGFRELGDRVSYKEEYLFWGPCHKGNSIWAYTQVCGDV